MSQGGADFRELRRHLGNAPCLSVRQPWAELILLQRKKVELRLWSTSHRGWTWLHTGRSFDEADSQRFGLSLMFTGGFVGAFYLRDVLPLDDELWDSWRSVHLDVGERPAGVFGWVIGNPLRLSHPLGARGNTGLYQPDAELLESLLAEPFMGES